VTIADIIVVYLSCGAPFGVLVFLSKHARPSVRTMGESLLAAVFWPIVALSWTHRRLLFRQQTHQRTVPARIESKLLIHHPTWAEYETLTRAMLDVSSDRALPTGELFEIAGHSNPQVAAICSERKRNALLDRRRQASSAALLELLRSFRATDRAKFREIADHCRLLGDLDTARLIDEIGNAADSNGFIGAPDSSTDQVALAA
jgi:hypothetical protein